MKLYPIQQLQAGRSVVLKENYTFLVADATGEVGAGEEGLYNRDTRYLSRYSWRLSEDAQQLLIHYPRPDHCHQHVAVMDGPTQVLSIRRDMRLGVASLTDELLVANDSSEPRRLTLELTVDADFADLFQARGWHEPPTKGATAAARNDAVEFRHEATDGLVQGVSLRFEPPATGVELGAVRFELELPAGHERLIQVSVVLDDPLEKGADAPDYGSWSAGFPARGSSAHGLALRQAELDLRALLLFPEDGPLLAAGIPWFVTAFGRDSLISAYMLLPHHPQVAVGTLRYLAARQGTRLDPAREEAPGKILHEVRQGELARTGRIPFGRYYGTIDATLLYVMLLGRVYEITSDLQLLRELEPTLDAAMRWLAEDADLDGDGFVEFAGDVHGRGLAVQSWKDSHDSLSHASGELATGAVAVCEVQGYAYAALDVAATCYTALGRGDEAAVYAARAVAFKERFHEAFWLPRLGTYALALDHDKRPLEVLASDAGHLLWAGIVPDHVAPRLAETLMDDRLFSGWGIRTLGTGEVRYNPLSYHNGSVWPHDTALAAAGLFDYGFEAAAFTLRDALLDLAASQPDLRPPELVAGYARTAAPPVPYPVACRPQAWSSAALIYLAGLGR